MTPQATKKSNIMEVKTTALQERAACAVSRGKGKKNRVWGEKVEPDEPCKLLSFLTNKIPLYESQRLEVGGTCLLSEGSLLNRVARERTRASAMSEGGCEGRRVKGNTRGREATT